MKTLIKPHIVLKHAAMPMVLMLLVFVVCAKATRVDPRVSINAPPDSHLHPGNALPRKTRDDAVSKNQPDAEFQTLQHLSQAVSSQTFPGDIDRTIAKINTLAANLAHHDLPDYVHYYQLKPHLKRHVATDHTDEILAFLDKYHDTAIAEELRHDWLIELGKTRRWSLFDEQYPRLMQSDDKNQVKCYALISALHKNQGVGDNARSLLINPRHYGHACTDLIIALSQSKQWTADDVWFQIRLGAEINNKTVIHRLTPLVPLVEIALTQAIDQPLSIAKQGPEGLQEIHDRRSRHEIFLIALGHIAKNDPMRAEAFLMQFLTQLSPTEQALAWAQIAYPASLALNPHAWTWWQYQQSATKEKIMLSPNAYRWRTRSALRAGDWKMVKSSIEDMPADLQQAAAWTYWLARADQQLGHDSLARKRLTTLSHQPHFYGQLALEALGQNMRITANAPTISLKEVATIAHHPGLHRALRLFEMGMHAQGVREWHWALRQMNDQDLVAAAECARQNNLPDQMVYTAEKTHMAIDFHQRFPMPYRDILQQNAHALGLDLAWMYGLIRQESSFAPQARSPRGASGLMQLMPATATWVAKNMGMRHFTLLKVNDIATNVALGTHYLHKILNDLAGSQALASAAYNAGPERPRAWCATLPSAVEGAIFIESIPFDETRTYVKNVLFNATYYEALLHGMPPSLKARLGWVGPTNAVATPSFVHASDGVTTGSARQPAINLATSGRYFQPVHKQITGLNLGR